MTFERIYKHITEKCARLGASARNPIIINEWLSAGYDTDKDIIPAIDWLIKVSPEPINSFYRFTGPIKKFHAKRIVEKSKPREATELEKAKGVAFRIRKLNQCIPHDERWLERYEAEHGEVVI